MGSSHTCNHWRQTAFQADHVSTRLHEQAEQGSENRSMTRSYRMDAESAMDQMGKSRRPMVRMGGLSLIFCSSQFGLARSNQTGGGSNDRTSVPEDKVQRRQIGKTIPSGAGTHEPTEQNTWCISKSTIRGRRLVAQLNSNSKGQNKRYKKGEQR